MPFDSPFPLGPFMVEPSGRLSPTEEGIFPAFTVLWRGNPVHVAMARRDGNIGMLALQLTAGRVCSTAADAPTRSQSRRECSFATLRALTDLLPPGWQIGLAADHGVRMVAEMPLEMPASANALISVVTEALLTAGPYLDVLEEAGMERGRAKT